MLLDRPKSKPPSVQAPTLHKISSFSFVSGLTETWSYRSSVTWCCAYLFNIWPFTKNKKCPMALKIDKVRLKFSQILNKPWKTAKDHFTRLSKFCHLFWSHWQSVSKTLLTSILRSENSEFNSSVLGGHWWNVNLGRYRKGSLWRNFTLANIFGGPWWWWSNGQRACLLPRLSEFESRWRLQLFL